MNKNLFRSFGIWLILVGQHAIDQVDGPDFYQVHGVGSDDVLNIHREANAKSEKAGEI